MIVMIIYLSSQLKKGNVHKFINLHCVFIAVVQIEAGVFSTVKKSVAKSAAAEVATAAVVDAIEG